jgi:hypothetical protein
MKTKTTAIDALKLWMRQLDAALRSVVRRVEHTATCVGRRWHSRLEDDALRLGRRPALDARTVRLSMVVRR